MSKTILVLLFIFSSCSSLREKSGIIQYKRSYQFTDISGTFSLSTESGLTKDGQYFKKRKIDGEQDNKTYEKTIAISEIGSLKMGNRSSTVLRPIKAQYTVWFNKKKFFSQTEIDKKNKKLIITMSSPEAKYNGVKSYNFPGTKGIFCFFSQMVDCIRVTNFFKKSMAKKAGKLHLTIIWDGYPLINEQYDGIGNSPFSKGILTYEGLSKDKKNIYHLSFNNQVIYYHLNDKELLDGKYWVAQGLSQTSI